MFTRRTVRVAWNSSPSVLTVLVIVLQHHCRCCGKLFCDDGAVLGRKHHAVAATGKDSVRVCQTCNAYLVKLYASGSVV